MSNDDARRIEELEEQVRRQQAEIAKYKETVSTLLGQVFPYQPITDEELHQLTTDTSGTPILEIVAELERKWS